MALKFPPVVQMAAIALLMWLCARWLPDPGFHLPGRRFIVLALIVAGFGIAAAGIREFRRARTTVDPRDPSKASSLVTAGVYRFTRNPMYLGSLLVLLAWGIYLGNVLSLLFLPVYVVTLTVLQIQPEERAMQAGFGEEYERYRRSVRRWI